MKINKIFLGLVLSTAIFAKMIHPVGSYEASGAVTDLVLNNDKLYSATTEGIVDIFNIKTKKHLQAIHVPGIKDFMGDNIDAKVYAVDVFKDNILILSQAPMGYRNVFLYKNKKLIPIITKNDSLSIAKAKFLDENTLIFGLLSNEIISYNIKTKSQNWMVQASGAKFSNLVLSEDKKEVVIADESGNLKIINTNNGKITHILKGQNLDNVFQVDYKNGIIATAGQDRRVVVYNTHKNYNAYYKQVHFLIYSVGISKSGNLVGFASDENNNVTVFNTSTKEELGIFTGNKMTLTNILFIDEENFLCASDDKTINLYKIK